MSRTKAKAGAKAGAGAGAGGGGGGGGGPHIERKYSMMSESALSMLDNIEMSLERFTGAMLTIDEQFNVTQEGK
jgi:hypothetical protein